MNQFTLVFVIAHNFTSLKQVLVRVAEANVGGY